MFTPAKLNTTLDEHTRFAAEEKSSDNFETEKVIVDDPSQKHLAADQSAAIPSGNGEGPQLIYGDSVPEFEITSETVRIYNIPPTIQNAYLSLEASRGSR